MVHILCQFEFINDLPLLLKNCHVDFFADDATAHTSNKDIEIINAELQSDFSIAISWSKQNKLPINHDKTTYMVLGAKKRIKGEYHLVLKADNHTIDKVTKQRLLGIIIDDHLTWTAHIDYLCSTLAYLLKSRYFDNYPHTCPKRFKSSTIKVIFCLYLTTVAIHGERHLALISNASPNCKNVLHE